jgi:hypothetical protein
VGNAFYSPTTGQLEKAVVGSIMVRQFNGKPDAYRWDGEEWIDIPEGEPAQFSSDELKTLQAQQAELAGLRAEKLAWVAERQALKEEINAHELLFKELEMAHAIRGSIIADLQAASQKDKERITSLEGSLHDSFDMIRLLNQPKGINKWGLAWDAFKVGIDITRLVKD